MNITNYPFGKQLRPFVIAFVCLFLSSGCAGHNAKVTMVQPFPDTFKASQFSYFVPTVKFKDTISPDFEAADRIRAEIIKAVQKADKQPFGSVEPSVENPLTLAVDVVITQYEGGNAMARMMFAGLGQMHIDGEVAVRAGGTTNAVAKYIVNKTFAWGGMYGGGTTIKEVEPGFAGGVVAPLETQFKRK